MAMRIHFPENLKVHAGHQSFTIETDQPVEQGGDGSAPAPFDLFLASIGTCAGIYVLRFCQKRDISTEGLEVIETWDYDTSTHLVTKINLEIKLPAGFPEKYRDAIVNSANLCAVKRHLENPPAFNTFVTPA